MKVAPLSVIGVAARVTAYRAGPQFSIASLSFRSKIPLGNCRRNLDRMVPAMTEWVGGIPSGVTPLGSLYQVSRVIHWSGASRTEAVTHSVRGLGPSAGTRGKSAYAGRGKSRGPGVGHLEAEPGAVPAEGCLKIADILLGIGQDSGRRDHFADPCGAGDGEPRHQLQSGREVGIVAVAAAEMSQVHQLSPWR